MPEGDRQSGAVSRDERCGSQQKRVRVARGRCARVSGILSVPGGTSNPAENNIYPAHVCTAWPEMIVVDPALCALRLHKQVSDDCEIAESGSGEVYGVHESQGGRPHACHL